MFDLKTVNDVFARVSSRGATIAMLWQDGTEWKPITSADLYGRVRALAQVLQGWGVAKGDRVAILSENRWEWAVTDFATLALAAVDVPLYATLTPEQIGYMLRDSAAKVAIVSTRDQYQKLLAAGDLPALEHVVVMDQGDFGNAESFAALMQPAATHTQPDPAFDAAARRRAPPPLSPHKYTTRPPRKPPGTRPAPGPPAGPRPTISAPSSTPPAPPASPRASCSRMAISPATSASPPVPLALPRPIAVSPSFRSPMSPRATPTTPSCVMA